MKDLNQSPIIFFDGVCGLCNGFVDFVIKIDTQGKFYFSPLQSAYASQKLESHHIQNLSSIVVLINGETFTKAQAVAAVFKFLGGKWKFLSYMNLLPSGILNSGYDFVASNRYRLFGKKETCRLPTPSERARFIL